MAFKTGFGCESLRSMKRRSASHLQMAVLHFEKLTLCFCKKKSNGKKPKLTDIGEKCRRCWTIIGAKKEMQKAGIRWVRGVESDVVGTHRKSQKHTLAQN